MIHRISARLKVRFAPRTAGLVAQLQLFEAGDAYLMLRPRASVDDRTARTNSSHEAGRDNKPCIA